MNGKTTPSNYNLRQTDRRKDNNQQLETVSEEETETIGIAEEEAVTLETTNTDAEDSQQTQDTEPQVNSVSTMATPSGNGQAILTAKEIEEIRDETPYAEVNSLLKRYSEVDTSEDNTEGISYDDMLFMPEFIGSVFAPLVIAANVDSRTQLVYARQFVKICSILSQRIKPEEKKNYLFELLNIYGTGLLTHDEIYRMYKHLFSHTVSDDHILALTLKSLNHTELQKKGQITRQEFFKMIPDHEIMNRMTINFKL